jgi:hypothetical protein
MDMTTARRDETDMDGFERRARAAFEASVDSLDAGTRARLAAARREAVTRASEGRTTRAWYVTWAPAGALAASVLAAALLLRTPVEGPGLTVPSAANPGATHGHPLDMLAADEDFAIATSDEDLEFYAWVDLATTSGAG